MRACGPGSVRHGEFLLSTLFGSASGAGGVGAVLLLDEIEGTDTSKGTTLPDLELSLRHMTDAGPLAALREIVTRLEQPI